MSRASAGGTGGQETRVWLAFRLLHLRHLPPPGRHLEMVYPNPLILQTRKLGPRDRDYTKVTQQADGKARPETRCPISRACCSCFWDSSSWSLMETAEGFVHPPSWVPCLTLIWERHSSQCLYVPIFPDNEFAFSLGSSMSELRGPLVA